MHTHTYVHEHTCASNTPSTRWSTDTETRNLYTNIHTHTHTHVCKRIHIHIHTHMHIYTYTRVRIHTHIHIYTHPHTKCTYERTQSTSETTARQRLHGKPNLTPRSSALLHVRWGYPSWPAAKSPVHEEWRRSAEQPPPTAVHRTITTARRPGHIRLSAEPIHPVHSPPNLRSWPWPSRPSDHFSACLAGFMCLRVRVCTCVCLRVCLYCCVGGWGCVTEPFLHQTLWMCYFCQARLYTNHHISIFYSSTSHVNTNVIKNKRSSQTIAHVLFSLL